MKRLHVDIPDSLYEAFRADLPYGTVRLALCRLMDAVVHARRDDPMVMSKLLGSARIEMRFLNKPNLTVFQVCAGCNRILNDVRGVGQLAECGDGPFCEHCLTKHTIGCERCLSALEEDDDGD